MIACPRYNHGDDHDDQEYLLLKRNEKLQFLKELRLRVTSDTEGNMGDLFEKFAPLFKIYSDYSDTKQFAQMAISQYYS